MDKIRALIDEARVTFSRLTQREQLIAAGGAGTLLLVLLLGVGAVVSGAIASEEHRVQVKTEQLMQVLLLQSDYKARQAERDSRLRSLGSSDIRPVPLVEGAAKAAGVDIGQLNQEDAKEGSDGIAESRTSLRAAGLSVDRLQDFLNRIDQSRGIVLVRRLKLTRPYKKDLVDVDMSISTYKVKAR